MNAEDRNQMTDRLLDAALARYSDTEPRDGLEGRILANLGALRPARACLDSPHLDPHCLRGRPDNCCQPSAAQSDEAFLQPAGSCCRAA